MPSCARTAVLIFVLSTFILPAPLHNQTQEFSRGSVVIKRLSIEQGLSHRNVWHVAQDSRGFIWAGTDYGLNRYNGDKFIPFEVGVDSLSLIAPSVSGGICADRDGIVWAGTPRGLFRFDPITASFKRYVHDPHNPQSLTSDTISCISIDGKGTLWVGTPNGLNKLDRETETWTHYYPRPNISIASSENRIRVILEDRHGTFWIGTGNITDQYSGGGLFIFDPLTGKFASYGPREGIGTLYEQSTGEFWVSTAGPHLYAVDRSTGIFTPVSLPPRGQGNPRLQGIRRICEDRSGSLWMATRGWGLLRYHKQTKTFTQFSYDPKNSETISSSVINTVFTDRDGIIWVGTDRAGVNVISNKPFLHLHTLGTSLTLASTIDLVFQDIKGFLWVGSRAIGLWRYDPNNGTSRCLLPKGAPLGAIEDEEGIIWFADRYTVLRYNPATEVLKTVWEIPAIHRSRNIVTSLMFDREKNLWLGGNNALFRVSRDMKQYRIFLHDPNNERSVTAGYVGTIVQDRSGTIWIGTAFGLNRFEQKTESFIRFPLDRKDSLNSNVNLWPRLHIDREGTIWTGDQLGLHKFNETTGTFTLFVPPQNNPRAVTFIQEDKRGMFWYVSSGRIMRFSPSDGNFTCFTGADGIEDVDILPWSHTLLRSGEILFGTNDGIMAFHPDSVRRPISIPPIVIAGIKKFDRPVQLAGTPELLRDMTILHGEDVFSISYSALGYDMQEFNQYAYKLEGFDREWVPCGNKREVVFTNLDPGKYVFRVKGANYQGAWNDTGASLVITVEPAWWQTAWFRALAFASIIVAAGASVRFVTAHRLQRRIEQLERERAIERDRARISQDLHDDIGSSLSEIAILSSLGKQKPKEASARLEEISERAASVVENLGEIVWAINPKNDTLDNLFSRIRRYSVNYLGIAEIRCSYSAPDHVPPIPVSADVRRNIFLVVKEVLHNVVKHARASRVSFDVSLTSGTIIILIADNGIGFSVDEKQAAGNGLGNMKRRMDEIGGTLVFETAHGKGTRVELKAQVRQAHDNTNT